MYNVCERDDGCVCGVRDMCLCMLVYMCECMLRLVVCVCVSCFHSQHILHPSLVSVCACAFIRVCVCVGGGGGGGGYQQRTYLAVHPPLLLPHH